MLIVISKFDTQKVSLRIFLTYQQILTKIQKIILRINFTREISLSIISELILLLLEKNPSHQFIQNELVIIFKKNKVVIGYHIRILERKKLIIVKKHGSYRLIRWNDPLITPIPHTIELRKLGKRKKKEKQIYIPKQIRDYLNMEIHVPKKIRDQLNWREGSILLFIEKDEKIFVILK